MQSLACYHPDVLSAYRALIRPDLERAYGVQRAEGSQAVTAEKPFTFSGTGAQLEAFMQRRAWLAKVGGRSKYQPNECAQTGAAARRLRQQARRQASCRVSFSTLADPSTW